MSDENKEEPKCKACDHFLIDHITFDEIRDGKEIPISKCKGNGDTCTCKTFMP